MSPRNEINTAIPFDASCEANEPLIPAGDAEEEDQRLEEKAFSRRKISALLLGLLVGFFIQFSILGAHLLFITLCGEDFVTKSNKANVVVFSLLLSFFTAATAMITYWAAGGRSKDLLEEMVWHIRFNVGVGLAWTTTGALLGMRAQSEFSLVLLAVALVWCKIVVMYFAIDNKPSSSRRSLADEIMTAV
jgi:uncharacterized membrane protein YfcA